MSIPAEYRDKSVCVIGLGYVGMTLAATMADIGFDVWGIEIRDSVLESIGRDEPHFYEPGLPEMLARINKNKCLKLAKHIKPEVSSSVYIITVGTPLGEDGRSRMEMIKNVSREVSANLKDGDLVIMRSTVKIGTTRNVVVPILEKSGVSFDLAFCPERTLEGVALQELRYLPQIVSALDLPGNIRAAQLFQFLTPTVVRVDSLETAEMIKLIDNVQRDVNFGFSNEIARMCDEIGISAKEVISAGKLGYPRTNLPMPGPVGGPCLGKDGYILAESMEPYGLFPEICLAARRLNERQPDEIAKKLSKLIKSIKGFPKTPEITIAGIAFKGQPETDDTRGTMAIPILEALRKVFANASFRGYDFIVHKQEIEALDLVYCPTLNDAFTGASIVVIANNHPIFGQMPIGKLAESMSCPGIIYDFWNNFSTNDVDLPNGRSYISLGSFGVGVLPQLTEA